MTTFPKSAWHPIAAEHELPYRHVYHAKLLGYEFAVWRADDDTINVWENRCLHRGVRLSIGINTGSQLKCQYHGWRYASGTAACAYIPAHPANAPARTIRNRTYPAKRRYGLVWSGLEPEGDIPEFAALAGTAPLVLRAIPVRAPVASVHADLVSLEGARQIGPFAVELPDVLCLLQPVATHQCVIRGLSGTRVPTVERIAALRQFNELFSTVRARVEASAPAAEDEPVDIPPSLPILTIPASRALGRSAELRVRVARKWNPAAEVAAFRLESIAGSLPPFEAGAHIDVHLPNGLVRQYSLTNGPSEASAYVIGVKREPVSTGGSSALHDSVQEGDVLAISLPHNNFGLCATGRHATLVAGGIGITPILAMAKTLSAMAKPFVLHYFARSDAHVAFRNEIAALKGEVVISAGLDAETTKRSIVETLASRPDGGHLYICGPGPMLEATRFLAEAAGWPEAAVHFEYFANNRDIDRSSSFEVALARSALTLKVPAGKTIVEVLRENGVTVPTSCEQGACGTCLTTVIDGVPDHQDVYLSKTEQASGACIMPCVSRSRSPRLVLDL